MAATMLARCLGGDKRSATEGAVFFCPSSSPGGQKEGLLCDPCVSNERSEWVVKQDLIHHRIYEIKCTKAEI